MKPFENKWEFIKNPLFKDENQTSKKAVRQHAKKEIKKELINDFEFLDIHMLNISHLK